MKCALKNQTENCACGRRIESTKFKQQQNDENWSEACVCVQHLEMAAIVPHRCLGLHIVESILRSPHRVVYILEVHTVKNPHCGVHAGVWSSFSEWDSEEKWIKTQFSHVRMLPNRILKYVEPVTVCSVEMQGLKTPDRFSKFSGKLKIESNLR